MTLNKTLVLAALLLLAFGGVFYVLGSEARTTGASAYPGGETVIATTTNLSMAAVTPLLMIATSSGCTARTIGTGSSAIQLSFGSTTPPTGLVGFPQAASTTVTYDSGQFGCGAVYGFSFIAQTVKVQDAVGSR